MGENKTIGRNVGTSQRLIEYDQFEEGIRSRLFNHDQPCTAIVSDGALLHIIFETQQLTLPILLTTEEKVPKLPNLKILELSPFRDQWIHLPGQVDRDPFRSDSMNPVQPLSFLPIRESTQPDVETPPSSPSAQAR
jgi:hypothetical protein